VRPHDVRTYHVRADDLRAHDVRADGKAAVPGGLRDGLLV
jgi:hypothetical protein